MSAVSERAPVRTPEPVSALPVRAEIGRQFGRRRTQVAFAIVAALPLLLVAAFEFGSRGTSATLADLATRGGANLTVFGLFAASGFLFGTLVALFCGDPVPAEASWSSLRYLLAAGIPRARLLTRKLTVAGLTSLVALLVFPAVALVAGGIAFGWGGFVSVDGSVLGWGVLWWRLLLVIAYIAVTLLPIGAIAAWFGVWTDAPLGAVGGAVLVSILSTILDSITALGGTRQVLPTHFDAAWFDLLGPTVTWDQVSRGALYAVIWTVVVLLAAYRHFLRKDILS
jgi:ABC-2 type transport system permease protein